MSRKRTLAIDFDGTLCKYQPYADGVIHQEPNEGAVEIVNQLAETFDIVIFTCRAREQYTRDGKNPGIVAVYEWCKKWGIPAKEITAEKPIATAYIDDRAIRFTNWQDIKNYFT